METLQGSNFRLRPWVKQDATNLVKHANNEKIAKNLRDGFPNPYSMPDAVSWITMVMGNKKDVIYAIEVDGEACGGIGLHGGKDVYRFNAEVGYWLSEQHWGKGITTEAVGLLVKLGFEKYSWTRIYAGVFSTNLASMKVLEKCGFKLEAVFRKSVKKRGAYLDEFVYSMLKEDWEVKSRKEKVESKKCIQEPTFSFLLSTLFLKILWIFLFLLFKFPARFFALWTLISV
ncbi:MAG: GNAT family protein [Bacteroidales bacterium]|nr:GNAT family protein [Bacteroidales bacterium]